MESLGRAWNGLVGLEGLGRGLGLGRAWQISERLGMAWEGLEGLTMVWQGLEGLGMVCRAWKDLDGLGRIFKTSCPLSHTVRGVAVGAAACALSRTARRIAYLSL